MTKILHSTCISFVIMMYFILAATLICAEGTTGVLSCSGSQKIKIISAFYGRISTSICPIVPILTIACSSSTAMSSVVTL